MKQLKLSWLLLGNLLASTGMSFIWPLTTIYLHDYLRQTLSMAGTVLLLESLIMILGSYLGGYIFDHLQPHFWLLIAIGLSVVSMFLLIFFNGWPAYAILLILNGFGGSIAGTIINSLATLIQQKDVRYVFNLLYFMSNLGVVLGTVLVGIVVKYDIRLIFAVTFVMFVIFWLVAKLHYNVASDLKKNKLSQIADQTNLKTSWRNVWLIFSLLLVYLTIELGYSQWQSNLSIYMQKLGISLTKYSSLWTLNGVLIVFIQPLLNYLEEKYQFDQFYKAITGFCLFIIAFVSLLFAKDYLHFALSMVWITLGEVIAFPTISALADQLSSAAQKGKYQGLVSISASLAHAAGPLVGGIIIENLSYRVLFLVMAGIVIVATLSCLAVKFMLYGEQ